MASIDFKNWKTRSLLLCGVLILGAGGTFAVAHAQHTPRDPATLPELRGTVAQYDLTPRGDVDGLIMTDGTEVHFPPHLGSQVQAAVHPGDAVIIRGERDGPVVRAGSIAPTGGAPIVDLGPPPGGPHKPGDGPARQAMEATGIVKMQLHGPRGDLNGVLLQDGTIVHLPPKEAARLVDTLKPDQTIAVRGEGVAGPAGRSIGARQFGPSMDKLAQLALPPPPPPPGPGPKVGPGETGAPPAPPPPHKG